MGVGEKGLSEGEGLDESMRKDCVAPAVIDQSCLLSLYRGDTTAGCGRQVPAQDHQCM